MRDFAESRFFRLGEVLATAIAICALMAPSTVRAEVFFGNGKMGFGGAVGLGSVELTSDGTTIFGTFTNGGNLDIDKSLVLYFDTVSGGFSDTSGFNDRSDLRSRAVSGVSGSGSDRSILTFPSGFLADYAIALSLNPTPSGNYGMLFKLANGGDYSLDYIPPSVNLQPNYYTNAATYTFSFKTKAVGLLPETASTISMIGSYISTAGHRSDEAVGGTVSGTQGPNPFTSYSAGTLAIVPEPGTVVLLGMAGCLGLAFAHFTRCRGCSSRGSLRSCYCSHPSAVLVGTPSASAPTNKRDKVTGVHPGVALVNVASVPSRSLNLPDCPRPRVHVGSMLTAVECVLAIRPPQRGQKLA